MYTKLDKIIFNQIIPFKLAGRKSKIHVSLAS